MVRMTLLAAAMLSVVVSPLAAQTAPPPDSPLAGFERLVGGRWHLGEDSYQVFNWGLEGRSVQGEMHFVTPDGAKQVSEMTFLHHPSEDVIKGFGVAVHMGVDFFEYDVAFRGNEVRLDLRAYGPTETGELQRETWTFTDDDHYVWKLFTRDESGEWTERCLFDS